MFEAVCRAGLEGMVSKKLDSPYRAGEIESLDQGQESEGASCHTRARRNLLIFRKGTGTGLPGCELFRRHRTSVPPNP